jgi:hypothetical protein
MALNAESRNVPPDMEMGLLPGLIASNVKTARVPEPETPGTALVNVSAVAETTP